MQREGNVKKIRAVEYLADMEDLTVWFEGNPEPFGVAEFRLDAKTRKRLERLQEFIAYGIRMINESES